MIFGTILNGTCLPPPSVLAGAATLAYVNVIGMAKSIPNKIIFCQLLE